MTEVRYIYVLAYINERKSVYCQLYKRKEFIIQAIHRTTWILYLKLKLYNVHELYISNTCIHVL